VHNTKTKQKNQGETTNGEGATAEGAIGRVAYDEFRGVWQFIPSQYD
jgi:hypothetical protein